jgi:UDP-glucose:(glucosyl)LPS alpha-1,2-glucosyltransferase
VVGDAALLVPPGDARALAEAMLRVATDEALRGDLVARGRERAHDFPPARTARMVVEVLRRAREGRP